MRTRLVHYVMGYAVLFGLVLFSVGGALWLLRMISAMIWGG